MALTNVEAVRLKSSDKSTLTREVDTANGESVVWKLGHENISNLEVRRNGSLLTVVTDYSVDLVNGVVTVPAAAISDDIEFSYYWSVFSDDEVSYFLSEAGDNVTIATARLLLAWAADAAKLAKRQTLSGGGGLGQVVVDTSVAAKELRETAKALINTEQELGESIPAEGFTEIPWTEQIYKRMVDQDLIRNN